MWHLTGPKLTDLAASEKQADILVKLEQEKS
jgi:hypothetical protein